jgi:hypothetical protein
MIEGGATPAEAFDPDWQPRFPNGTDRRLAALAAAIRDHESRSRHTAMPARPEDLTLYRRLRQICGERYRP